MAIIIGLPDPPEPALHESFVVIQFGALKAWLTPNGWRDPHRLTQGLPEDALITRVDPVYEGLGYIRVYFVTRERVRCPLYVTEETFHDSALMERLNGEPSPSDLEAQRRMLS